MQEVVTAWELRDFPPARCHIKMGTHQNRDPFSYEIRAPVPNFIIFWGPWGPHFHVKLAIDLLFEMDRTEGHKL